MNSESIEKEYKELKQKSGVYYKDLVDFIDKQMNFIKIICKKLFELEDKINELDKVSMNNEE